SSKHSPIILKRSRHSTRTQRFPISTSRCMFIPPQGVRVLATAVDIEALLTQVMESLKARSYARSELMHRYVKQMSGNTALVSVSRIRYTTDGRELERVGETYTLRRTEGGWKIAVAMIHDPDSVLP